jgi:hypothetical protein
MSEPSKPSEQAMDASGAATHGVRAPSPEQTLLGVSPPVALPPLPGELAARSSAPAPVVPRPASSGAIAASRMISVSDSPPSPDPSEASAPGAAAPVTAPPQAPPLRPASLGGWQSANPGASYQAPSLIQTLTNVTSPLAEPQPAALEQPPAAPTRPAPVASASASAPAPVVPDAPPAVIFTSSHEGAAPAAWQPVMHTVPIPVARAAAQQPEPPTAEPKPETFASTALSDDYLRAARDAAKADPLPIVQRPTPAPAPGPSGEALANAATLQFESVPPVRAPLAEQPPASVLPISLHVDSAWQGPDTAHAATQPLEPPTASVGLPSWRVVLLVAISVLALVAIAAAMFVAVRRFSSATTQVQPTSTSLSAARDRSAAPAAPVAVAPRSAEPEAELSARAAELVVLGRRGEAQPLDARLAAEHPSTPAYGALQRILARSRSE